VTYSILYQLHSVFPGKKKSGSGGRHKWTDEQLTELKRTFSFAKKNKKLPKLKEVEALVQMCPNVNKLFKQKRVTISAIKNKIDRIYNITVPHSPVNSD
jgi:ferritin